MYPNRFRRLFVTLLPENLGKHCREWPAGKTESEIKFLIEENSKPQDLILYTDGSVTKDLMIVYTDGSVIKDLIVYTDGSVIKDLIV